MGREVGRGASGFTFGVQPSRRCMSTPQAHRPTRSARISARGQVTVPKPVRDYLGLDAGSAVEFEVTASGDVVLRKRADSSRPLRGLLAAYAPSEAPTTEALDAGIGREVERLDRRSRIADDE